MIENEISAEISAFLTNFNMIDDMTQDIYTVTEAAEILKFSEKHLRDLCRRGDIKATRIVKGGKWLIPASEIKRLKEGVSPSQVREQNTISRKLASSVHEAIQVHIQELCSLCKNLEEDIEHIRNNLYIMYPDARWDIHDLIEIWLPEDGPPYRARVAWLANGEIVDAWLRLEEALLFNFLRSHMGKDWSLYEEWKQSFAQKTILYVSNRISHKFGNIEPNSRQQVYDREKEVGDKLLQKLIVARHRMLPGTCEICKDM